MSRYTGFTQYGVSPGSLPSAQLTQKELKKNPKRDVDSNLSLLKDIKGVKGVKATKKKVPKKKVAMKKVPMKKASSGGRSWRDAVSHFGGIGKKGTKMYSDMKAWQRG
jgi:hypothetical protein